MWILCKWNKKIVFKTCFWEEVSSPFFQQDWKQLDLSKIFPRLINALRRNAVSKIIVATPLVVIMKDQVEQLQSIGIRALAIEVDEEEVGEMDRLDYL